MAMLVLLVFSKKLALFLKLLFKRHITFHRSQKNTSIP